MINLDLLTAADQIKKGKISALELVNETLRQIHNVDYNAIISLFEEEAILQARQIDNGKKDGLLAGIPVIIKDNIDYKGKPTTCASNALRNNISISDAEVVKKLIQEGAIIIGKANMDEFAMGSDNTTSAFGKVLNPINTEHVPGGSSGGSACVVASKQCFASLGTDTGGSIRQPASYCGIVGLKPTYGSVSSNGCFPLAASLDQIGPLARTVSDCAVVFGVIANGNRQYEFLNIKPAAKKVVLIKELFYIMNDDIANIINEAAKKLEAFGCSIKEISIPTFLKAHIIYKTFAYAEMAQSLSTIKENRHLLGTEVKRRILAGRYVLNNPKLLEKAKNLKEQLIIEMLSVLSESEVILLPIVPSAAYRFDDEPTKNEIVYSDTFSQPASIVGLPSISVPFAKDKNGMPIGIQLVGRKNREIDIFSVGKILEQ